jgi:hypothetical protein
VFGPYPEVRMARWWQLVTVLVYPTREGKKEVMAKKTLFENE